MSIPDCSVLVTGTVKGKWLKFGSSFGAVSRSSSQQTRRAREVSAHVPDVAKDYRPFDTLPRQF